MGTKTQSWLKPGEQIIFYGEEDKPRRPIRFVLITLAILAPLSACTTVWAGEYTNFPALIADSIDGILVGCAIIFIFFYQRTELVLTGDRLICRQGLFSRSSGEVAITDIGKVTGAKSRDDPLDLELNDGRSLKIEGLPELGALREILEKSVRAT